MKALFLNDFEKYSHEEVVDFISYSFRASEEQLKDIVLAVAQWDDEDYEGYAYFLYFDPKTRKFYEVSGSHCSCYGFEDQWEPCEVPMKYLKSPYYRQGNNSREIHNFVMKLEADSSE